MLQRIVHKKMDQAIQYAGESTELPGAPNKFEDEEFESLLDEGPRQTQSDLASALNIDRSIVAKCLKAMETVRKG